MDGSASVHSLGGMTLTMPLCMPQHSIRVMYSSKSSNSSIVGLKTGIPLVANGSSSGVIDEWLVELGHDDAPLLGG